MFKILKTLPIVKKMPQALNKKDLPIGDNMKQIPQSDDQPIQHGDSSMQNLLEFLKKYSSSEEFRRLKKIDKENEKLKKENETLQTTNDTNLQSFMDYRDKWAAKEKKYEAALLDERTRADGELQKKKEAVKALEAERDRTEMLQGQIDDQDKRLIRLVESVKKNEEEIIRLGNTNKDRGMKLGQEVKERKKLEGDINTLVKQVDSKSQELAAKNDTIRIFRAFIVPLTPLHRRRAQMFVLPVSVLLLHFVSLTPSPRKAMRR